MTYYRRSLVLGGFPSPAVCSFPRFGRLPRQNRFAAVPALHEFVDKGEVVGAVTLTATKDRIFHLNAVGKSDQAGARKMNRDPGRRRQAEF